MRPEKRHAIRPVRPRERPLETGLVVDVAGHNLRPERGKRARLLRFRIAHNRSGGESAVGVVDDGSDESPALRAGGAEDGNDFLAHGMLGWIEGEDGLRGAKSTPSGPKRKSSQSSI